MVGNAIPASVSHAWRVPPVNARGRPEEKPRRSTRSMRDVRKRGIRGDMESERKGISRERYRF
jgi:hypothetical protein